MITCANCQFNLDGVCRCNLSDKFKTKCAPDYCCAIIKKISQQAIFNFTDSLSNEEAAVYAGYIKDKYPDKMIGNIYLFPDVDPDYVIISYETFPDNFERRKKVKM